MEDLWYTEHFTKRSIDIMYSHNNPKREVLFPRHDEETEAWRGVVNMAYKL